MSEADPLPVSGVTPPELLLSPTARELRARLAQASERVTFLAAGTRLLSGALQFERAVDLVLTLLRDAGLATWVQLVVRDHRGFLVRSTPVPTPVPTPVRGADGGGTTEAALFEDERWTSLDPFESLSRVLLTGRRDLLLVPEAPHAPGASGLAASVVSTTRREELAACGPTDLLNLPLRARGSTYGVLTLARPAGTVLDTDASVFLDDLTERVALALDASRMLGESRRVAAVLGRDLAPPALPVLAGVGFATYYRVAFEQESLGGDFYDVHGEDEAWTAVLGDVTGKGVEAAVLTGRVRQSVRTAALVDRSPDAVLSLTNRVLRGEGDPPLVTALCVRGRREGTTLRLDVAAAGHPSPFVVRRDGRVERLDVTGTVLGLLDEASYDPVTVHLAPQETCVMFTDGVAEAPGGGTRFGEDRIEQVLATTGVGPATGQVESLAMALSAHLGSRPHDDIAILAVQHTGA